MPQILYRIRNVADTQKATCHAVLRAPALKLEVKESLVLLVAHATVEDMNLPAHRNLTTTQKFQPQLQGILEGTDPRYHLWEVRIYRQKLELDFADRRRPEQPILNVKSAALRVYINYPAALDMKIWTPHEQNPYYQVIHVTPAHVRSSRLMVIYTDEAEGLEYADTYEIGIKRSEIYPKWE